MSYLGAAVVVSTATSTKQALEFAKSTPDGFGFRKIQPAPPDSAYDKQRERDNIRNHSD
jgi:hypothetical protein